MIANRASYLTLHRFVVLAILFCFILMAAAPTPVRADIAPEPWAPGNTIGPSNPTQVRMLEEAVQMDLVSARQVDPQGVRYPQSGWIAFVRADFEMRNLAPKAEDLKVYFPLGMKFKDQKSPDLTISDFQVWVDEQPVTIETIETPDDKNEGISYTSAVFPVSFPVGQTVKVRVSYSIGSQFVPGVVGMEALEYIFQTGAAWKSTIGKAVLKVNLPDKATQESVITKPKGGKIEENSITWTWENFEPAAKDNFSLVIVDPEVWDEIVVNRSLVEQNPADGAALTRLGAQYLELASGKMEIAYPEFAKLARATLQKATHLSPFDPEPHFQLFQLYYMETGKMGEGKLTQDQCTTLVNEINQYLLRITQVSRSDEQTGILLENYHALNCANKPALSGIHGIFPTLTATPVLEPTATRTENPAIRSTRAAFMQAHYPATETPTATAQPSPTVTPAVTETPVAQPVQAAVNGPIWIVLLNRLQEITGLDQTMLMYIGLGIAGLIVLLILISLISRIARRRRRY